MKIKVNPPYKALVQMPLCCGVCSFLWTLHRRGYWIDQEEIAQACNLYVPKEKAKLFTLKMKIAEKKEDEGTSVEDFHIDANKLLKEKNIALKIEKESISKIRDPKEFIIKHMKKGNDLMLDFACKPFPEYEFQGGHVCVVSEFDTETNEVTLGDPSWIHAKYWKVSLNKLVEAMDKKYDGHERGFWIVSEND